MPQIIEGTRTKQRRKMSCNTSPIKENINPSVSELSPSVVSDFAGSRTNYGIKMKTRHRRANTGVSKSFDFNNLQIVRQNLAQDKDRSKILQVCYQHDELRNFHCFTCNDFHCSKCVEQSFDTHNGQPYDEGAYIKFIQEFLTKQAIKFDQKNLEKCSQFLNFEFA